MKRCSWVPILLLTFILLACALACGKSSSSSTAPAPATAWTDSTSGLTWQVTPFDSTMDWADATSYCQNLALDGGSWRLPSISELRTLVRGCVETETGGACGITDSCLDSSCSNSSCDGCATGAGPNGGCYAPAELANNCCWNWSSSAIADDAGSAWYMDFSRGFVDTKSKAPSGYGTNFPYVRCVR